MPIYYNNQKIELKQNIITDLELVNSIDSSSNPIYSYVFDNSNTFSKKCIEQVTQYYTTDIDFLKDNLIQHQSPYANALDSALLGFALGVAAQQYVSQNTN